MLGTGIAARCPADGRTGIENDNLQTDEHQPWVWAADPAVATGRQNPKAEPDRDGAVARTIGAFPLERPKPAGLSIATALERRLLVGLNGAARGRETGGVRRSDGCAQPARSVCLAPESGHSSAAVRCPFGAMNGPLHAGHPAGLEPFNQTVISEGLRLRREHPRGIVLQHRIYQTR
jgi:hypothetical protein